MRTNTSALTRSAALDPSFPTIWRNMALCRFNKFGERDGTLEKALALDTTDACVLLELVQLRCMLGTAPVARLSQPAGRLDTWKKRDDLAVERVALLNELGRHGEAAQIPPLGGRRGQAGGPEG